jgi:Uma2 family endonuclease
MMTSEHELQATLLDLLPTQGHWSEEAYLWLTDQSNQLLEYSDGYIEVLPMPTKRHQAISRVLFFALFAFLQPRGGTVFYAPLRLRLPSGVFREPDLLALRDARDPRAEDRFWHGADLVVEIVSADKPDRDLVTKRREYAEAGIPEYWIVNPLNETITVLVLQDNGYREHGVFARGAQATSALLPEFAIAVNTVFDAE